MKPAPSRRRRPWRWPLLLLRAAGSLVMAVIAIGAALLWMTLPPGDQAARIPGLSAPVTITLDEDGVPRIRAANALDGAAALGFVHARDRMFQMDLMRRSASGRLSELAGSGALPLDRLMLTLGLRRAAEADLPALPAETRAMLDAYARGVNAVIADRGRFASPEFLPLGAPEPWTALDCLLWGKTLGLYLSSNWTDEIARFGLAGRLSPERIQELRPSQPGGHADARLELPAVPGATETAERLLAAVPAFPAPFTLPRTASNEWAVDGKHSATGSPLLAGDPHLAFSLPGIWYLARVDTPDATLAGATSPGVPFLLIGHNRSIAWSFTTTGADVQDVFIETPAGTDSYLAPDGPRPYVRRTETIHVRGAPDETLVVRETRHGPVVSDLGYGGGAVLTVQMANLSPGDTASNGLLALDRATTVEQARQAGALLTSPNLNLLVADRAGIGLSVTGRVPVRASGDGAAPVPGADGKHDWTGWASGDAMFHVANPSGGRLVNANERVSPDGQGAFLGRDFYGDWRSSRIRTMLDAHPHATTEDFAAMQVDSMSDYARRLLPALRATVPGDAASAAALRLFDDWDCGFGIAAAAPVLFDAWMPAFRDAVLTRAGVTRSDAVASLEFVALVLSPEGAHWCGEAGCAAILASSLAATAGDLRATYGDDPARWRWGNAHQARFAHPVLGRLPILGPLTTVMIAAPGDDSTVDRGGTGWAGSLLAVHGASYRGVYDLSDLDRSLFVVAPGQSGNLLRPHATDFMQRWRDGGTITLGPNAASVEATIRLAP